MFFRVMALAVSIGGPFALAPTAFAQAPTSPTDLVTGINQVKAGDYFGALVTLNTVVNELASRIDQLSLVARARAYQALSYALLEQPERAREFATLALAADPNVATDAPEFTPAVAALFTELRQRPAPRQSPEAVGDGAIQAGATQEAFLAYLRAFQALPEPMAATDDQRLREKIVGVVQKMTTKPVVPDDARSHFSKAKDLLDAEAILGGAVGKASDQAAVQLRQAIRLAPWWGDAAFQLATVLQRLNRVDEALVNLGIYRIADPAGFAARAGRAAPRDPATPAATAGAAKPAGPALLYIYWPEQQRGGGRQKLFCNGQQVADLQNNRYVVLRAAPGTHDLAFRDKHVPAVVDADRVYHFRTSIEGHWQFAMGPEIRLIANDAAKAEMSQQEMKVNDARRTRSAECAAPSTGSGRRR